jgi:NAD(P)-dependent dehydrogenase (short-subunit alcohol dehydrogenase family)
MTSLRDKSVLVTGGAKNLGGSISRTLAGEGARIAVHYNSDSTAPAADETVAACKEAGGEAFAIQGDLTKVDEVKRVFDTVLDRYGSLYASVNTAGMAIGNPVREVSEEEFDRQFAVNTKAAFFIMAEAARRIDDGGKILTIVTSLLAAYTGRYSVYEGSKAPVEHFTRALSKELMDRHVSVNSLAPGPMDTPFFWNTAAPGEAEFSRSMTNTGDLTKIEDVVPWVKFLLTYGRFANGQTLFVNGGFSTR